MLFYVPLLYVQISPERLLVRNPKTGVTFDEPSEVAVIESPIPRSRTRAVWYSPRKYSYDWEGRYVMHEPRMRVVGVGSTACACAGQPLVKVVNPFGHPRSLVSDFTAAEQLLKVSVRRVIGRWVLIGPRIVMHPLGDPEGGFTQVEWRAFFEMAMGAGASQVVFHQGPALTDKILLSGAYLRRHGGDSPYLN